MTGEIQFTEITTHDQKNINILNILLNSLPQWNATYSISGTFIFLGQAWRQPSPCVQHQITKYLHWAESFLRSSQLHSFRTYTSNYKTFRPLGQFILIWRLLLRVKRWQTFGSMWNLPTGVSLVLHAVDSIWNVHVRNLLQIKCWAHNCLLTFYCCYWDKHSAHSPSLSLSLRGLCLLK
jgi:hypothetical protein